ncbi:hypothetical protein OOU_Y34scaffold00748g26 [Pyricularia oryzae Y34]|uniref:Uncharacterized protein n=2 Tax=Pyricularia oryzae TaxID=318829 RepID=A0AA97NR27_PYRO3|nr:hypothetical protein OOU_Y34scaffold00748g26 [Pyricularia oryzae Y34]
MGEWWVWLKAGAFSRDGGLEATVSLCDDLDRPSYCRFKRTKPRA